MCKELYIWETAASHHVVPGDQIHLLDAEAIPTDWGRNPWKCRETTYSSLWKMTLTSVFKSESLMITLLRNPWEWRRCQKSHLSVTFHHVFCQTLLCLKSRPLWFAKNKQANEQTNKKIHIYKYSSWLHAFVSANSSRLACLVSVV